MKTFTTLNRLPAGTRFRLAGMPEVRGTLVSCGECSACVDLAERQTVVHITDRRTGAIREFVATKRDRTTWSPGTIVETESD